jgi:hypothetical protein
VHYPRAKDAYRQPTRYRAGDRFYTWHYLTRGMDALHGAGMIDHTIGRREYRRESIATATDKLLDLLDPVIDFREPRGLLNRSEVIVLRDRVHKVPIDYDETAQTVAMREEVTLLNAHLGGLHLRQQDKALPIPILRRIFNGDFDRGGRLYCHGSGFQNLPETERRHLLLAIDGQHHPVVEIDYANLHITMAYKEAGKQMPPGDQYRIKGFDRELVKLVVNVLFNAASTQTATGAIAHRLDSDRAVRSVAGICAGDTVACRNLAKKLVEVVKSRHAAIGDHFGSDCGARFQRRDSEMAIAVMRTMIAATGRCPLPVHDSFLVADRDVDRLRLTMTEVAEKHNLPLKLKANSGIQ